LIVIYKTTIIKPRKKEKKTLPNIEPKRNELVSDHQILFLYAFQYHHDKYLLSYNHKNLIPLSLHI